MQDSEKLSNILAKAHALEEKISGFIASFHAAPKVLEALKQEISQFITSNQASAHVHYIENQATASDILLTAVIKQFSEIKKLIDSKPHNAHFFHPSPKHNLTQDEIKKLALSLQTIREELNKLPNKASDEKKLSPKSAAPSA